jgi:hypothetical protein
MPVQAHNLPWASLAANFEYRPARSTPGPQTADIYPRGLPTQAQQVEHFVAKFREELDEHVRVLRCKLKPAEEYKARASTWNVSIHPPTSTPRDTPSRARKFTSSPGTSERPTPEDATAESQNLRRRIETIKSGWSSEIETRPVFDLANLLKYEPYREHSQPIDEFRSIERWLDPEIHPSLARRIDSEKPMWDSVYMRNDVIKLMIIDVAAQDHPLDTSDDLESLLLLAHHPKAEWGECAYTPMPCCNISAGIDHLAEFAMEYLLYFGLLETMIDNGEDRLMSSISGHESYRAYMTLKSARRIVNWLTISHEHLSETVPFKMFGMTTEEFPDDAEQSWEDCYMLTKDVMSDRKQLATLTKWTWKILVITVLLRNETSRYEIDWEWEIIRTIDQFCPGREVFGMPWIEYDSIRRPFHGLPPPDAETSEDEED